MNQTQKITIIGGDGYIGTHLKQYLNRCHDGPIQCPAKNSKLADDMGVIFYCAGKTSNYAVDPHQTIEAHVNTLARILATGKFSQLIYLSSLRLYDFAIHPGNPYTDFALNNQNPRMLFDISKLLGEWLVLRNPNGKVIRLGNVFGGIPGGNTFLSEIIGRIRKGEMNLVVNSSSSIDRYYIHIDDVCSALYNLTRTPEIQILNLAYPERVSNAQIAGILEKYGFTLKFAEGAESTQVKRQVEISFKSDLIFESTFESKLSTEIRRR